MFLCVVVCLWRVIGNNGPRELRAFSAHTHTGYARIVLAVIAFYFMRTNYVVAGWCYIVSALLDSVDGHAARAFNQSKCDENGNVDDARSLLLLLTQRTESMNRLSLFPYVSIYCRCHHKSDCRGNLYVGRTAKARFFIWHTSLWCTLPCEYL